MPETADHRPKILVVDDSKVMRLSARKILSEEFDLLLAEDGLQAWEQLQADAEILALFSDVGMPGLDGYALLERIRAAENERLQAMPVIIVTGNEEETAREEALQRGASDFITKPFDRAQLLARARSYATHDRMQRRARELEASNTQDAVTGLGNKRYFEKRLKEARANSLRHDRPMALLRADMVEFEQVLADRGKRVGAELLKEIAEQFRSQLREEDVIARLSGARFAVICPDCDRNGAESLLDRVGRHFQSRTFAGEHQVSVRPVVGAYFPGDLAEERLNDIYAGAQKAVDQAAEGGPGTVVCLPELGPSREQVQEDKLVARLERLLASYPPAIARRALARLSGAESPVD